MNLDDPVDGAAFFIPAKLGPYRREAFETRESFLKLAREIARVASLEFALLGRLQLEFQVFCTRDPKTQAIEPAVYLVRAPDEDYTRFIKDVLANVVALTCKLGRAQATVFMSEAWTIREVVADKADEVFNKNESLEFHPNRIEVLSVIADHARWGTVILDAEIVRHSNGTRTLRPWEERQAQGSKGRFVQFLVPPDAAPGGVA